jgi:hypothetical protein
MRINEALRLRVKDVEFDRLTLVVREGKGGKDRALMLPQALVADLRAQLAYDRALWLRDRAGKVAGVELPHALARKYPRASESWAWHWVFERAGSHTAALSLSNGRAITQVRTAAQLFPATGGLSAESNTVRETQPASAAPTIGATQNNQSCPIAQPPAKSAGPVLRAGFTGVFVTGMLIRWISVSARPMARPAKPTGARGCVAPRITKRQAASARARSTGPRRPRAPPHTLSKTAAMPCPPPMHMVTSA